MKAQKNISGNAPERAINVPAEIPKERVHIIVEIIEYVPNVVVSKTIIKKSTGNINVLSFATREELAENFTL